MLRPLLCGLIAVVILTGCSKQAQQEKIRLAINPWPGYEFLYLAGQKGFFVEHGLNVEIVELSSLADVQRIYIQGRVDALARRLLRRFKPQG